MSKIDLGSIQYRLRVEGIKSKRAPLIVGAVRRILWPFIRSYHYITLDWVREVVVQNTPRADVDLERLSGRLRAFRAEILAQARVQGDLQSSIEAADMLLRELEARVQHVEALPRYEAPPSEEYARQLRALEAVIESMRGEIQRSDFRIAQLEALHEGRDPQLGEIVTEGEAASAFPIGNAICCRTPFGPVVMKRGDLITNEVLEHGTWDSHLIPWLKAGAKRGTVAIDAGAHFGTITCAMAKYFAQVHAFEPNFENYTYLCANAAIRPRAKIRPHNTALYSRETELSLARPEEQEVSIDQELPLELAFSSVNNTGGLVFSDEGSGINKISARTVDSFSLSDVGIIKIDCQGSDAHVIFGAIETIRRCRPLVVFEWEENLSQAHGVTFQQAKDFLAAEDYDVFVLYRHNDKQIDYIAIPN
ncbi:FkbM family methyltransferase [Segnochrobactrum spirostomi]|uniref:FkbM family methyltransferase n=1 Tax=Segnochrobactrum spirostomi TaxID=2608987 RepID=A0A6A7Y5J2_9HYPH|nr:FkbM family methyltransferase [Segnochrobactrum spirostomi]MQT13975.1 FkbM family methyltransferase [Segnochrobactrum spirostomi]